MFTAVLAVVVEHQVPTPGEAAGLVALTGGVMLAVYEGAGAAGPFAVFLCVLGTICNAAMMTFSGKLLSERIDVLRLAFYTAPVSLLVLLPFLWMREARPGPRRRCSGGSRADRMLPGAAACGTCVDPGAVTALGSLACPLWPCMQCSRMRCAGSCGGRRRPACTST